MMGLGKTKTRIVLQMEAAECGAACLTMMLSAHGREITLEEARERCGTSRDGVDAGSIARAATSYNMKVKAVRLEPETLDSVPLPAIMHWNFDHFVVIEAVKGTSAVILDPATGRRTVSAEELNRNMTGLILAMVPGEAFEPGGMPPKLIPTLIEQAKGSFDGLAIVFAAGVLGIVPGLILSGVVQTFADYVIGEKRQDWLIFIVLALVATIGVQAVLRSLQEWTVTSLKSKIGVAIAARAFEHALFLPLSFFSQRNPGEVVSRLKIGSEIGGLVAGPLAQIFPNVLVAVGYLTIIFLYDGFLGSAVSLIAIANLVALIWLSKRLADANRYQNVVDGRTNGIATAGFMAFDSFRLMGREDLFASKWLAAEETSLDAEQRLGMLRILAKLGPSVTATLISIFVLSVGSFRAIEGELDLSALLALQVLAGLVAAPVAAIAADYCALQEAAGSLLRLGDLMHHPIDPLMNNRSAKVPAEPRQETPSHQLEKGVLSLDKVSFGYGSLPDLFSEISHTFKPGVITGVLGRSGVGKSTFARICAGMQAPRKGQILFEGRALDHWRHEALRQTLLYVPQAGAIFTASVRDNLTMWDKQIDDDQIEEALEKVGMTNVVHCSGGLDRMISSQQPAFSGGEIQRLALARALVRKPSFLVLDEVTSALDALSEKRILETLRDSQASVLIVTHRTGTTNRCDQQLVLDGKGGFSLQHRPDDIRRAQPDSSDTGRDVA
ncbi:ABC-type bacteriocin/lantibiotic exporter, contains an N-terminal double-glycine peptidase domain [Cohaesibacter sp. ES.047]|uniref:cysteine peptidase family C39 domain-containing protein n=1 Tax=Cohaesibacter sp. ES.047 TaxID=1798205 RepID=UPI000BBF521D|nr:cysteine peptidase family C39 domain-containing protein [Cohaesibacter sp. ES.047]SNY92245.1 ABC-type bacteriocin/lantibiotic exporter, contains an N-terminal double-glycine peptidase domain [Cohaesibacter sp. ES.047]